MFSAKIIRKTKGAGLQGFIDNFPHATKSGVEKALESTQKLAVKFSRGRVADSIQIELIYTDTWEVKGRVYTNSPFAAFLEYGTGIYMEPNPLGHIPGSAGDKGEPWYVHEDMADLSKYNFPVIETEFGKFYIIKGTHAHPYMQPAAFQNRDKNVEAVLQSIQQMIRSVI